MLGGIAAALLLVAACQARVDSSATGDGHGDASAGADAGSDGAEDADDALCPPGTIEVDTHDGSTPSPCGCTRRPCATPDFQCPRGVGQSVTSLVDPDGGTVELAGQQGTAAVTFPPTTFGAATSVTLTETSTPPPRQFLDWSPLYRLDPVGQTLGTPARVRVPWGGPNGVVPPLAIYFSTDGTTFTRIPDSYTNAGFEQGSLTQLGWLIVGIPRTDATANCP